MKFQVALFLASLSHAFGCSCSGGRIVYDKLGFEVDAQGRAFKAGDTPFRLPFGITVSGQRRVKGDAEPPTENDLVIFNTARPTGMDYDLGTNDEMKVLIINESSDKSNPDDARYVSVPRKAEELP